MINRSLATRIVLTGGVCAWLTATAFAQVTPAGGYTPPEDTPKVNVGATIFGDYTYQQSPQIQDVDKNNVKLSSFNIASGTADHPPMIARLDAAELRQIVDQALQAAELAGHDAPKLVVVVR